MDKFVYVESDPPLTGKERHRDYSRQYHKWMRAHSPEFRDYYRAKARHHYHNTPGCKERCIASNRKRWADPEKRVRLLEQCRQSQTRRRAARNAAIAPGCQESTTN